MNMGCLTIGAPTVVASVAVLGRGKQQSNKGTKQQRAMMRHGARRDLFVTE